MAKPNRSEDGAAAPTIDERWRVTEDGYSRAREHEIESLFTVANGSLGTRGSLSEAVSMSNPATFLAGFFVADQNPDGVPGLLSIPDWTRVQVFLERRPLSLERGRIVRHRRILDLRQGILWREWLHRNGAGRLTGVSSMRIASLSDRRLLLQRMIIAPENYAGRLRVEARLDASNSNGLPWTFDLPAGPGDPIVLRTVLPGGAAVAMAIATEVMTTSAARPARKILRVDHGARERWTAEVGIGDSLLVTRLVSVHSSRNDPRPDAAARRHVAAARTEGVDRAVRAHVAAWRDRWRTADLRVVGDDAAQRALRFAAYHLIAAADPEDERTSVGARALTGRSYKGHVFWDTEIYMLPFYTFTDPPTARALLMYRSHTLDAARAKARTLGYCGALYAWESTDTGEEATPATAVTPDGEVVRILTGEQEHHISADVAYAVWQYWQATGDETFFLRAGAEILIETARFWASRGRLESDGRYHIRGVIGPDEYHETVDDNAFTNVMAQWNLERGADAARLLRDRWPREWEATARRLELQPQEPETWLRLADATATGFDPRTHLFEQFQGYFGLEDVTLPARPVALDVWLGRDRLQRFQGIKQADVVALSALLWDRFPREVHEANFRYYEPRTAHGSSLSPAFHALVAARLGDARLAETYFRQTADIDLANNMGNAAGGVHIAALGGLWQAAVCGMAGLRLREHGLCFDPCLPAGWRSLSFSVHWRSRRLHVTAAQDPDRIEVHMDGEDPMEVELVGGARTAIGPGTRLAAERRQARWQAWHEMER